MLKADKFNVGRVLAPALHLTSKFQCNNIFAFQKSLQTETEVTIMSDTNFYDSLSAFAASQPLRMCMPGHKGRRMPMEEWDALAPLDFTELPPTGNLYGGDDWLEGHRAEHDPAVPAASAPPR